MRPQGAGALLEGRLQLGGGSAVALDDAQQLLGALRSPRRDQNDHLFAAPALSARCSFAGTRGH